ncbi:MAG: MOSC domain-containing protein [Candidatus Binataceae bacterium]
MRVIGAIKEIWRFPVKSMAGERLERSPVGVLGIIGDRGWALRDERVGEIRGAKKMPDLMRCHAAYVAEPAPGRVPDADIILPSGECVRTGNTLANEKLSALVGRPVTLWPIQPPESTDFYRRARPDNPDMVQELRDIFGRTADEPIPDLSVFPPEIIKFTSPLGTYFDAFPLHLITTASLSELARRNPAANFDVRRFRPNILIETDGAVSGFADLEWSGQTITIGEVRIKLEVPCPRCVMPTLPQDELPKDPSVLRTIVRESAQNVGMYASVARTGEIAVGDEVRLE